MNDEFVSASHTNQGFETIKVMKNHENHSKKISINMANRNVLHT